MPDVAPRAWAAAVVSAAQRTRSVHLRAAERRRALAMVAALPEVGGAAEVRLSMECPICMESGGVGCFRTLPCKHTCFWAPNPGLRAG
mmetsp:Transcript_57680/g.163489  ORF Transcript_57680/g.163489 Transcript_57680/m.163489 type:complete len:88 (+) Transcript_57680:81-344(+)